MDGDNVVTGSCGSDEGGSDVGGRKEGSRVIVGGDEGATNGD
jgi:hypothetical protein